MRCMRYSLSAAGRTVVSVVVHEKAGDLTLNVVFVVRIVLRSL